MTPDQDAELALLVIGAMDSYLAEPTSLIPPIRHSPAWRLMGHITGNDVLLRAGQAMALAEPTCYGFIVQSAADPTLYAVAIRGTASLLEWLEDAKFLAMPHPVAGNVERGFYTLYETLQYRPLGSTDVLPLAQALTSVVGAGRVQIVGHSLGAPLATYLAFDVAAVLGDRVEAFLFASPRPGDATFGAAFRARVKAYTLWNYDLDVVPRVPVGLEYSDLPLAQWLTMNNAQARIGFSIDCHHHLLSYLAMLNYARFCQLKGGIDTAYVPCIKGPNP